MKDIFLITVLKKKYLVAASTPDRAMKIIITSLSRNDIDFSEAHLIKTDSLVGLKLAGYQTADQFAITDYRREHNDLYVSYRHTSGGLSWGQANIASVPLEVQC